MFSNNCRGETADTYVQCDTFNTEKYKGIPFLDVTAVYSKEANAVFINVVNRHQDKPIATDITNIAGEISGKAEVTIINSDALKDPFVIEKQSQYQPVTKQVETKSGKLSYTFPAHSFTQIKINVQKK